MTYSETVEERDGYRVRLEIDDDAQQPEDDGSTPILQIGGSYYGRGECNELNKQAQGFHDVWEALDSLAHSNSHHRELFARFVRIFHGASKVQFWNEGVSNEYGYVAFDTATWREAMGITDLATLKDEDYLSEIRAWATGEVYGHIVEKFDDEAETWQEVSDGTCWGLYGHEWAEQAAKQALADAITLDSRPLEHTRPAPVVESVPERPTLKDEAERLLSYWEAHGDNPETVAKWAITDMLGILRYILEDEA